MTFRASGHHNQRALASASAVFAIEMWRAAVVLLVADHARLSDPLDIFLLSHGFQSLLWKVVPMQVRGAWQPAYMTIVPVSYFVGQLFCSHIPLQTLIVIRRNANI